MSLFQNLRHGLDAYTTDTVCLTITYNKQTAACGYKFLSPKLNPVIKEGLIKFLDLWFSHARQSRAGYLNITREGLVLNGYTITLDNLFTEQQQSELHSCLNINSYLAPFHFKNTGVFNLSFTYNGGGDEGHYEFDREEDGREKSNFLEARFWKNCKAVIEEDDLINLERLVDLLVGSFEGEPSRDGAIFIDLVKTEITIEDTFGSDQTTLVLNSTDQFERTANLSYRDLSYLVRPLAELMDVKYLILQQGLVYTATEFAIMQVMSAEREIEETALGTSCNHVFSVQTKQRQISSLGFAELELSEMRFQPSAALDLAFLLDASDQITVLRISTSQVNTIHETVKIPLLVRSSIDAPLLTERESYWLHHQVEGIIRGDLASLVLLVAEMDAVKAELLIN
jgi:hypothetical protein